MEKLLNEDIQKQLRDVFNELKTDVKMLLFVDEVACESCEATQSLLSEVSELSDKLSLDVHPLTSELAQNYDITLAPSFVMLDHTGQYKGVKFNGIPAGHEINSFISALLEMSGAESELPAEVLERIQKIDKPVNIKVFVTLSCPHCPPAVQKAHKIAMLNPNVVGEMIEAQTFSELSQEFNVSGVPKIVINDSIELIGNQPIERFLDQIESL
jgi:glutaredoxin-like protein